MQYYQGSLAAAAQAVVRNIWYLRVDFSQLPDGLGILPNGFAELVFHFGSACWWTTGAAAQLLPSPALIGLLQPVQLRESGQVESIGLKCFPWVLPDLPGLPAEPAGIHSVAALFAQLHASLAALVAAGQVAAALAHVNSYLAQLPLPTNRVLAQAGQAMPTAQGTLPISQVAVVAHTTARALERQFQ